MTQNSSSTADLKGATRFKRCAIPDAEVDRILRECVAAINGKVAPGLSPTVLKWLGIPPQPAVRKSRKTTLNTLLKQAAKAGKSVKGAEVYPDRTVLQFGEPTAEASANELDEWIANDARASERH